jgi:hypothetical protein
LIASSLCSGGARADWSARCTRTVPIDADLLHASAGWAAWYEHLERFCGTDCRISLVPNAWPASAYIGPIKIASLRRSCQNRWDVRDLRVQRSASRTRALFGFACSLRRICCGSDAQPVSAPEQRQRPGRPLPNSRLRPPRLRTPSAALRRLSSSTVALYSLLIPVDGLAVTLLCASC